MTATQQGVVSNPRNEAMAEVIKNATENTFKELKESGVDVSTLMPPDKPEPPKEEATEPEKSEPEKADPAPEPEPEKDPAPEPEKEPEVKTVKIKVDGIEQEVPEDKVREAGIRALQKESAADRRLEEATRLVKEAQQLKETVGSPSPKEPVKAVDAKALAHAIQYGSEDEAAEALEKLRATDSNPGLTVDQVAHLVDERTAFRTAVDWYKTEFKEIASDPDLHKLFLVKESEARKAGDSRPYRELYEEIGNSIRTKIQSFGPKPDPLKDKRDRKSSASPHPTSAASRQPAPQPTKEPTPSETIEKMRQARHQV